MNVSGLTGQVLDEKYRIDNELGRGGMGSVYLATHLGTERPVAVKVISPEFMSHPEFIERFRREARAAGRLRHPNVVDVTDFGFAATKLGRVAYLVMEYLDGCTLGEILEEEKNLPLDFSLDILEQVCSAVQEAHSQGIIHRDLKPDNIWLEPNQRGGYNVKVLDFGIAKLEEQDVSVLSDRENYEARPTFIDRAVETTVSDDGARTIRIVSATGTPKIETPASETNTVIQPSGQTETDTAILPPPSIASQSDADSVSTLLVSPDSKTETSDVSSLTPSTQSSSVSDPTSALTRIGAVLGTPLYMSPEQCNSERLDARSDIYSLGVIAYQMLSGRTPFSGDFTTVMDAHRSVSPPPLHVKGLRQKVKAVVEQALNKNPDERPQTAETFAAELRAQSEGIGNLLQRSLTLYIAKLPMFLGLSLLVYIPFFLVTFLNIGVNIAIVNTGADEATVALASLIPTFLGSFAGILCGYIIFGTTTWLVIQMLAVPLRPLSMWPALRATLRNWKRLFGTGMIASMITLVGFALFIVPGFVASTLFSLVPPVIMMEGLKGFAAMKRSKQLVLRSRRTAAAAMFIMFVVPFLTAVLISFVVAVSIKAFSSEQPRPAAVETAGRTETEASRSDPDEKPEFNRTRYLIRQNATSLLILPLQIFLASISSIIVALLYLKTRQVGGEPMHELLAQFEDTNQPMKKWQIRSRKRLIQSGRVTSRP